MTNRAPSAARPAAPQSAAPPRKSALAEDRFPFSILREYLIIENLTRACLGLPWNHGWRGRPAVRVLHGGGARRAPASRSQNPDQGHVRLADDNSNRILQEPGSADRHR